MTDSPQFQSTTFIANVKKGKSKWKSKGASDDMKFNAVIGNPPYQLMDGGAQASAIPIYNYFVDCAKEIEPDYVSMIMPSRWMTGGRGLDNFRDSMIHDKQIVVLHDFLDARECFSNVEIKGGVCYFLWEKDASRECDIFTHNAGSITQSKRFLVSGDDDVFIRDGRLIEIRDTVWSRATESFETMVSSLRPYGLRNDYFKDSAKYGLPEPSKEPISGGYKIYGLDQLKRATRYIPSDYPLPKTDGLNKYKVFISESYGSGLMGENPPSPIIGKPGELCTETFLQIGPFDTEIEAKNAVSYIETLFFSVMVGLKKNTQHATQKMYGYVPLVDFKESWSDEKLFDKFGLSADEIDYIKTITLSKPK